MKILKYSGLAFVALAMVCLFKVWRLPSPHVAETPSPIRGLDEAGAVQRLSGAIRIPTVSYGDATKNDPAKLAAFAEYLKKSFPRAHQALKRENIGPSLLYTWTGRDPAAKPILLLAHMDVVPVEPGTESKWQHPPFGGEVAEGHVWGRGAIDDKGSLMALMEGIEHLLAAGFAPSRTVMIAFGHDEEIGGKQGAKKVAETLKARGLHFEFALDEGGSVTEGVIPGVQGPVATIIAGEKGYASFTLTARDAGGHSSRPPPQTAIGRLARAVARVQDAPLPMRLVSPVTDMLDALAPEMPFMNRLLIANRWLFAPLIARSFAAKPTGNALVRTTTAPTMFNAGVKDNVLPSEAKAVINFRLLPGDTVKDVEAHIRAVVDDEGIEVSQYGGFGDDPSPVADTGSPSYALLARTVAELFPDAAVSTGLVIGATDLRNYVGLYEHRYNFAPFRLKAEDLARIHGHNERVSVADYLRGVEFYRRLLRGAAG